MYVCVCKGITEAQVRTTAQAGHTTVRELNFALGLHDPRCCGRCARDTTRWAALAADARPKSEHPLAPAAR